MTQVGESPTHIFYQTQLDGQSIKLRKDKETDELQFDLESVALALGYAGEAELLADPIAADVINEYRREASQDAIAIYQQPTPIRTN